jgi:hypothetical protein
MITQLKIDNLTVKRKATALEMKIKIKITQIL